MPFPIDSYVFDMFELGRSAPIYPMNRDLTYMRLPYPKRAMGVVPDMATQYYLI